jgi:HPt (histidine-containing phosphotransfer) domain-containing protein
MHTLKSTAGAMGAATLAAAAQRAETHLRTGSPGHEQWTGEVGEAIDDALRELGMGAQAR